MSTTNNISDVSYLVEIEWNGSLFGEMFETMADAVKFKNESDEQGIWTSDISEVTL